MKASNVLFLVTILWQLHISFPQTVIITSVDHLFKYTALGFRNKLVDAMLGVTQGKEWMGAAGGVTMEPSRIAENKGS